MDKKIAPVFVKSLWDRFCILLWNLFQTSDKGRMEAVNQFFASREYWNEATPEVKRDILKKADVKDTETLTLKNFNEYHQNDQEFLNLAIVRYRQDKGAKESEENDLYWD